MNESKGYIKVYRELINKPIWLNSTLEQRVILITLLCMANHTPKKWEWQGKPYEVGAGQFITSVQSIIDKCKCKEITRQKVRTALERFKNLEFLTMETTKQNTLITIVNWEKYQGLDTNNNQQINQRLTNSQPTANQRITTNKNVKNDKNDKEEYIYAQNDEKFNQFWEAYPKKVGKANAKKSFKKLNVDDELLEKILNAVRAAKNTEQWRKDKGRYIPHPTTWLNGRRWEDELEVKPAGEDTGTVF